MTRVRKPKADEAPKQDFDATFAAGLRTPTLVKIGDLTSDPENARSHDERNIESIAASLARFKQRKPIVVQRQGMIVRAGNGTLAAAKRLGWTHIVAAVVEEDEVEATAYAIADNRTAELAEWNFDQLGKSVQKYDLDTTSHALGFSVEEIDSIMSSRQWDGDSPPDEGGADSPPDDSGKAIAVTIKVKVVDTTYRQRVQVAIQELIEEQFKGLAKVV